MVINGYREEKIRKALMSVYRERENAEIGNQWQRRVMSSIRRLGIPEQRHGYQEYFGRLMWRFAPVTVAFILILAVGIIQFDFFSDFELTNILIEESADFSLLPSLET